MVREEISSEEKRNDDTMGACQPLSQEVPSGAVNQIPWPRTFHQLRPFCKAGAVLLALPARGSDLINAEHHNDTPLRATHCVSTFFDQAGWHQLRPSSEASASRFS